MRSSSGVMMVTNAKSSEVSRMVEVAGANEARDGGAVGKGGCAKGTFGRVTRALKICTLLVMAVLVAVPLALMNHKVDAVSDIDNRKLQELPGLSKSALYDGTYFSSAGSYAADRIGLRKEMIGAYSVLNDTAFGVMVHPTYEYGTDGYVFFRFGNTSYGADYVSAFADYILQMQEYCEARGIPFLYVISPEKTRIYEEYIPDYVSELAHSTEVLIPMLEERGINYVDQGEALLKAKEVGVQVFNVAYDAGHWNTEGMYAGVQMIIDRLQEMGIPVDDIDISEYEKVYTEQTSLPASNYPISVTTYKYGIKNGVSHAAVHDGEFNEGLELHPSYRSNSYYTSEQDEECSVLMFQGSYYNTQGTMLQNQFSEFAMVHDYMNVFNLPYYLDVYQPDVVIFENADYTVSNSYYSYDGLMSTELPPVFEEFDGFSQQACDETVSFEYDAGKNIASFVVDWLEAAPAVDYVYVLVGDSVHEAIRQQDGTYLWGAQSAWLDGVDGVTLVGVDVSGGTMLTVQCPLQRL